MPPDLFSATNAVSNVFIALFGGIVAVCGFYAFIRKRIQSSTQLEGRIEALEKSHESLESKVIEKLDSVLETTNDNKTTLVHMSAQLEGERKLYEQRFKSLEKDVGLAHERINKVKDRMESKR